MNLCLIEPVSQSAPAFYQKSLQVLSMITLKRLWASEFWGADLPNVQCCHSVTRLEACSITWNLRTALFIFCLFFFFFCSWQ